jgi:hypothetical protein
VTVAGIHLLVRALGAGPYELVLRCAHAGEQRFRRADVRGAGAGDKRPGAVPRAPPSGHARGGPGGCRRARAHAAKRQPGRRGDRRSKSGRARCCDEDGPARRDPSGKRGGRLGDATARVRGPGDSPGRRSRGGARVPVTEWPPLRVTLGDNRHGHPDRRKPPDRSRAGARRPRDPRPCARRSPPSCSRVGGRRHCVAREYAYSVICRERRVPTDIESGWRTLARHRAYGGRRVGLVPCCLVAGHHCQPNCGTCRLLAAGLGMTHGGIFHTGTGRYVASGVLRNELLIMFSGEKTSKVLELIRFSRQITAEAMS